MSMPSAAQLVASVDDLITLPDIYLKVKGLVDDPESALADVADVIMCDPAITARLLRVANSPFFGFASSVETVSRAVSLLGTQQVHDIVLATSVASAFSGIPVQAVNMETFWRDSVACGVIARLLAGRCNVLDRERLFVEGLLRNVGHLVMYMKIPQVAAKAIAYSKKHGYPVFRVERKLVGFDYAQVGGELMRSWSLPASLTEAIEFHTEPTKADQFPLEAAIVHVASLIQENLDSRQPVEQWELPIEPAAWKLLDLPADAIACVKKDADVLIADAVELFFPRAAMRRTNPQARTV